MSRLQRRFTATFSTGLALLALSAGVASAAPADLDPTFDADGVTHDAVTSGPFSSAGQPLADQAPDGSLVAARVLVNGKRVKVTRGNRMRARVNLTSLPKGRFAVKIRLRLKDGGIVRETRRYRTCTKKIRRQLKPLRTRAPRSSRG